MRTLSLSEKAGNSGAKLAQRESHFGQALQEVASWPSLSVMSMLAEPSSPPVCAFCV